MADLFANLSDLVHELRCAAGTVLTILGSRLEARERARVECGPQWLTEFEEQRDSLEPHAVCEFHGEWCAGETSWCTRQCSKCDEAVYWHRDVEAWFHCAGVDDRRPCPYGDGPVVEHSSAASALAADPSPADNHHASRGAGDEGPEGASAIPSAAPSGQPTSELLWDLAQAVIHLSQFGPSSVAEFKQKYNPLLGRAFDRFYALQAAESDPGAVTSPAPGDGRPTSELLTLAAEMGDDYLKAASVFVTGRVIDSTVPEFITELRDRAVMFKNIEQ